MRRMPASDTRAMSRPTYPAIYALPPRLLKKPDAAHYVGVGQSKFDEMVAAGMMPKPKIMGARVVWDIRALDTAIDDLPEREERPINNPWDDVLP